MNDEQAERLIKALEDLIKGFQVHDVLATELQQHFRTQIEAHTTWMNKKLSDHLESVRDFINEQRTWIREEIKQVGRDPLYARHVEAMEKAAGAADRLASDIEEGDEWKKRKEF
jgi:hypothetical protein